MVRNYTLNGTDIDPNIEMINSYIKVWSNTYATIELYQLKWEVLAKMVKI